LLAAGAELQMRAEGESLLCQKKQIILDKFDALLKKLGGQELSANITMDKVSAEFKEAMSVSEREEWSSKTVLNFPPDCRPLLFHTPFWAPCILRCSVRLHSEDNDFMSDAYN